MVARQLLLVASGLTLSLAACGAILGVQDLPPATDNLDAEVGAEASGSDGGEDGGDAMATGAGDSANDGRDSTIPGPNVANEAGDGTAPDGIKEAGGPVAPGNGFNDAAEAGCPSGMLTCNGSCVSPSDLHSCGSCAIDCTQLANVSPAGLLCVAGKCSYACAVGHADCGDSGAGCTTDLSAATSCGGCGVTCSSAAALCLRSDAGANYACGTGCSFSAPTLCNGVCADVQADTHNCGSCGHDCLGGLCLLGACQPVTLASGQNLPQFVAVGPAGIYWTNLGTNAQNYSDGSVMKLPIDGGVPAAVATGQTMPLHIVADATTVYWSDNTSNGTVMSAPAQGGMATTIAGGQAYPDGIAIDATSVYWTTNATVMKLPLGGGPATTLAMMLNGASSIVVDAASAYWTEYAGGSPMTGSVTKAPLVPGAATHLAQFQNAPAGVAVDATHVYWVNIGTKVNSYTDGTVMSVAIGGGAPSTLASGQASPEFIVVDTTFIYWTNNGTAVDNHMDGAIMKMPLAGGAATRLASAQNNPWGIAIDAENVYWANIGDTETDGAIMKVVKQ